MNLRTWSVAPLFLFGACTAVDEMRPVDNVTPEHQADALLGDPCIDVQITHILNATVSDFPPRTIADPEAPESSTLGELVPCHIFEGNGDAISAELARGRTEFKLAYRHSTQKISGFITTQFFFGEILEMNVDDEASVRYDHQTMFITADLKDASLQMKGGVRSLVTGEITLELPIHPAGTFPLEGFSSATLCLQ